VTSPATPVPARAAPPPLVRFLLVTGASGGIGRATAARLAEAALTARPRPRYRPGLRNRLNTRLLTMLPTRASDRIKIWITGMASSAPPAAPGPDTAAPTQPRRSTNQESADAEGTSGNRCGDRTATSSTLDRHRGPDSRRIWRSISLTGQCTTVDELQSGEENLRCRGTGLACPARVPAAAPGSGWSGWTRPTRRRRVAACPTESLGTQDTFGPALVPTEAPVCGQRGMQTTAT
jgi:hypothetical protein